MYGSRLQEEKQVYTTPTSVAVVTDLPDDLNPHDVAREAIALIEARVADSGERSQLRCHIGSFLAQFDRRGHEDDTVMDVIDAIAPEGSTISEILIEAATEVAKRHG